VATPLSFEADLLVVDESRRALEAELDPRGMHKHLAHGVRLPAPVTLGLTLAEAGVLSFRRVDAVAAMPVSFCQRGIGAPRRAAAAPAAPD